MIKKIALLSFFLFNLAPVRASQMQEPRQSQVTLFQKALAYVGIPVLVVSTLGSFALACLGIAIAPFLGTIAVASAVFFGAVYLVSWLVGSLSLSKVIIWLLKKLCQALGFDPADFPRVFEALCTTVTLVIGLALGYYFFLKLKATLVQLQREAEGEKSKKN